MEKRKTRFKDLHCTSYLATAIIVPTVKLTSTSAWTEHCPSWFQGCIHRHCAVAKKEAKGSKRSIAAVLSGNCRNCRTVGLLSDCRIDARASSQRNPCRTLSDNCRTLSDTVGLSNCRTVGKLSDTVGIRCRTVGPGLSSPPPTSRAVPVHPSVRPNHGPDGTQPSSDTSPATAVVVVAACAPDSRRADELCAVGVNERAWCLS